MCFSWWYISRKLWYMVLSVSVRRFLDIDGSLVKVGFSLRASTWLSSLALEDGAQFHLAPTNEIVMLQVLHSTSNSHKMTAGIKVCISKSTIFYFFACPRFPQINWSWLFWMTPDLVGQLYGHCFKLPFPLYIHRTGISHAFGQMTLNGFWLYQEGADPQFPEWWPHVRLQRLCGSLKWAERKYRAS